MGKSGPEDKSFEIPKRLLWEAYRSVKENKGAAGVDGRSIEDFESDLRNNLYKIWNRMSSGTYFPPPVRAVEIPKPHGGGTRILGVPTVADRMSRVITESGVPTLSTEAEGNTASSVIASRWRAPRGQRPCACTEPPCARTGRSRARPSGRSPGGPLRERRGGTPEMNERGKSDNLVVPAKPPNNAGEQSSGARTGRSRGCPSGCDGRTSRSGNAEAVSPR